MTLCRRDGESNAEQDSDVSAVPMAKMLVERAHITLQKKKPCRNNHKNDSSQ